MNFMQRQDEQEVAYLEKMYQQAVSLSFSMSKVLSERVQRLPESKYPDPKAYPPCQYSTYRLGEYPVYQLSYQGMLPLYVKDKQVSNQVKEYYIQAAMEATAQQDIPVVHAAFLYICHFFKDLTVRDLDNRNRSVVINAVRYAGFIKDDSWKEVEIMESGFLDLARKNHVQVFVTPTQNASKLIENIREKYAAGHDFSGSNKPDIPPS